MNSFVFTYNLQEIDTVAEKIIPLLEKGVILFKGEMGAGKTTFISALIKAMGSKDVATSPTFSIVNEYDLDAEKAYHFDFYRIESIEEALNFGVEEYIYSNNWVFAEWPEKVFPLLSDDSQVITIENEEQNKRSLKLTINKRSLTEINAMDRFK